MKKPRSAAAEQKSARLAARKIRTQNKARTLLARFDEIAAAGKCDAQLRMMRDELVGELWALRHTRRAIKGRPVEVLQ